MPSLLTIQTESRAIGTKVFCFLLTREGTGVSKKQPLVVKIFKKPMTRVYQLS